MRDTWNKAIKISDIRTEDRERFASLGIDFSSFSNCYILPGFADVHVHLREPGFLYKETIQTGTMAAAAGGFTDIFSMPNLDPCPDSREHLQVQLDAIRKDAKVHVYPYGAITVGEKGEQLADLRAMASDVIAFTDDGKGVASEDYMRQAMKQAKELGRIIVAHCEDESYPKESSESEWKQLKRDIRLVRETGCSYHVCHISTRESVELVRSAKAEGLDITCETAPHYLVLSRDDIEDHGRFKMNPPIKGKEDQVALLEALRDGTIDMIATDHAPHSAEEKAKGFSGSAFGIVGMETAFPVLYTHLVTKGKLTLQELIKLMHTNPRKRFGLPLNRHGLKEELEKGGVGTGVCGPRVRTITACQGSEVCPSGCIDTYTLAKELDARYFGRELPHKFKFGVTGCQNNCLKAEENDVGIKGGMNIAYKEDDCISCGVCVKACRQEALKMVDGKVELDAEKCNHCGRCVKSCPVDAWEGTPGYIVSFGGTFGNNIYKGEELLPLIPDKETLFRVTDAAITFFEKNANPSERFRKTLQRVGEEDFRKQLKEAYEGQ